MVGWGFFHKIHFATDAVPAEILQAPDLSGNFYSCKFFSTFAVSKTFKHVLHSHCLKSYSESLFQLIVSMGILLDYSTFHAPDRCCKLHFQKDYPFNGLNFVYVCTPLAVSNTDLVELAEQLTVFIYLWFYSILKQQIQSKQQLKKGLGSLGHKKGYIIYFTFVMFGFER